MRRGSVGAFSAEPSRMPWAGSTWALLEELCFKHSIHSRAQGRAAPTQAVLPVFRGCVALAG